MFQMARKLQNRLALAQFKTERGWEDLTLDTIEPKVEEELRRRRPMSSGDIFSDSSSSSTASEFQSTNSRTLLSSPLKSTAFFSDQNGSCGSSGHRKRVYHNSFDLPSSSSGSRKRYRSSPTSGRTVSSNHSTWKERQLTRSSPIKARKQPHFTTSAGPNLSFFRGSSHIQDEINYAAASDDEDDALPAHSFSMRSSPPRTPPPVRNRGSLGRCNKDKTGKSGEEGADLLLFLATSPSPANPTARSRMQPPSTPPPKNMALPSSMMTTPGGGGGLLSVFGGPHTPSQNFDFADFVNITPSPGQRAWPKTPGTIRTPATVARRHLNFEGFLPPGSSPNVRDHSSSKHAGLGMQLGGDLIS